MVLIFVYLYKKKFYFKRNRNYPDDLHAIEIDKLSILENKLKEIDTILTNKKVNTKIKLNDKKFLYKKALILGGSSGLGKR